MKLSEYLLKKSEHPAFVWLVFVMTVCESVFLFIPPEVFMTPAVIANRRRAVPVVLAAAAGSLVGGMISYLIGMYLFDSVGVWLIENFASMEKFEVARGMFLKHGILIIALSALTPIPYKLMAICAGFLSYPIWLFLIVSGVFRTTRFGLIGYLLWRYQARANTIVREYFWWLVAGAAVFVAIGVGILMLL